MKIWTTVNFKESDKSINLIAKSLNNYLFNDNVIYNKLSDEGKNYLDIEFTNKIAGILMLYYAKDYKRINDIVNKYNRNNTLNVVPKIEGYIEK